MQGAWLQIARAWSGIAALGLVLAVPLAARAQPYSGPPSDFTAYWEVPAFNDVPIRGPAAAKGLLLWSHGVASTKPEWQHPPPPVIKRFARAGWDVIKIQRNNLFESGWTTSGLRHVADLVQRIAAARHDGYRYVIAAGQSYGGAISLEASARTDQLFGVIAFAPGHGSDTCGSPTAGIVNRRISDNLQQMLVRAIQAAKAPRIALSVADGDECQGFNDPSQMIEDALHLTGARFVHFDASMPIRGHGAAETNQFDRWYGACLLAFLDPARIPAAGETRCLPPSPVPRFLFPERLQLPATAAAAGTLTGPWSGTYVSSTSTANYHREVCVVVLKSAADQLQTVTSFGAGITRELSMTTFRRRFARDGGRFVFHGADAYTMALTPAGASIGLSITSDDGKTTWHGTLKPGC